jgi:DNA-binding NarL/FixJ family response regulator
MQYATKIIMNSDAASKATPIHVLHVDDDAPFLDLSRQILADMGNFEVDNACSVDEAFEKLAACKYDIIVSDYEMPQKSGLQFLKELRSQNSDIPFILFTGKGREEIAMLALNLGADGYFNKQGDPETVYGELAYGIRSSLDRYQQERNCLNMIPEF